MRLGLLRNPHSSGNRGRAPLALPPGAVLAETASPEKTAEALAHLRAAGAEAIVVDGGDGTVRAVVTALGPVCGTGWPPIGILPHGNTNLIARRLGSVRGAAGLARLARLTAQEAAAQGRLAPVLRIAARDAPSGVGQDLCGFICGWGAYAEGTRIGTQEIAARHGAQVLRAVFATLRRTLAGRQAMLLRQGVGCAFEAEGHPVREGPRFVGLVTTLPGPLIGPLDPFWGEGSGALRWLDIDAPPRRLALAAPFALVGRPRAWMMREGYRSGRSGRIGLTLAGPLVLDGERIETAGARLVLTANDTVRVLSA